MILKKLIKNKKIAYFAATENSVPNTLVKEIYCKLKTVRVIIFQKFALVAYFLYIIRNRETKT